MTLVPFYSLLTVEGANYVKVVMDNIMAGKQENKEDVCFGYKHPSVALVFPFPYFFFPSRSHTTLQQECEDLLGFFF